MTTLIKRIIRVTRIALAEQLHTYAYRIHPDVTVERLAGGTLIHRPTR